MYAAGSIEALQQYGDDTGTAIEKSAAALEELALGSTPNNSTAFAATSKQDALARVQIARGCISTADIIR